MGLAQKEPKMQHEKPAQMPLEGGIEEGRARCDTKFQVCEN